MRRGQRGGTGRWSRTAASTSACDSVVVSTADYFRLRMRSSMPRSLASSATSFDVSVLP